VLFPLDEEQAREQLRVLARCEVQGVAICLINAYVDHSHEERLRELVREELGDVPCSISSEVSPLAKEYARASTTLIDTFMEADLQRLLRQARPWDRGARLRGQLNFADCAATLVRPSGQWSSRFGSSSRVRPRGPWPARTSAR